MINNNQDIQIKRLAEALTRLADFVPASKADLNQWYDQAQQIKDDHLKGGEDYLEVPHFLWHYLSDADIRMKSEVYAEMQNRQLNTLLEHLKRGVLPTDEDLGVKMTQVGCWSLITRWLGW